MGSGVSVKPTPDRSETAPGAPLRRLATELAADPRWIPEVSLDVAEAVHHELPELATEELRDATFPTAESNVRQAIAILSAGGDPNEAAMPAAAVEYAHQYARTGTPLDALLHAYQVGQQCFLRHLSDAVRSSIEDLDERSEALEQSAALTLAYINAIVRDLIGRYARDRDRWVRSAAAVRAETVRSLLAGDRGDIEAAEQRLRYSLRRAHLAFLVWFPPQSDGGGDEPAALERAASEFAAGVGGQSRLLVPFGRRLIAGWIGGYDGAVPKPRPRIALDSAPEARAALGAPGSGVEGFARSHRDAMHARRIAELAGRPSGSVVCYDDVALTALASADLDHARDFVGRQLGPLSSGDEDIVRLSATLRVYLEERSSPRRTAERLGVHSNTVANRVRAAQELLGEPIEGRVPELLVALKLAPVVRGALDAPGQSR
jgi:DNA-binding PucR family transcriptional regulator